jgi:hypothetical protein
VLTRYLVRNSLLLFYLRIFRVSKARPLIIASLVLILAEGILYTVPSIFKCQPVNFFWLGWDSQHNGRCINLRVLALVSVILGIACDVWMILLPVPFISKLNLPTKKKIQVSLLFAVGIMLESPIPSSIEKLTLEANHRARAELPQSILQESQPVLFP